MNIEASSHAKSDTKTSSLSIIYQNIHEQIKQKEQLKLGYPVSLSNRLSVQDKDQNLTFSFNTGHTKLIDNSALGIMANSLAEAFITNVGDPIKDSSNGQMEVKDIERSVIALLANYLGIQPQTAAGYVTSGGTESNFVCLWWARQYLINKSDSLIVNLKNEMQKLKAKRAVEISLLHNLELSFAKTPEHIVYIEIINAKLKLSDTEKNFYKLKKKIKQLLKPLLFYTKGHTHYSIEKIARQLNLKINPVEALPTGEMNLESLRHLLQKASNKHPYSSIMINANIGTTIFGAIDDVIGIKSILHEVLGEAKKYTIHLDGALLGITLPVLKPFGNIPNYFDGLGVNTLAMSGHKFLGSAICGIALTQREFLAEAFPYHSSIIEYVGDIQDITASGCRPGLNSLLLFNALHAFKLDKSMHFIERIVRHNLANAQYLYSKIVDLLGEKQVIYLPNQFNVVFKSPSTNLINKYQLMPAGNQHVVICVLQNVSKQLIDAFIQDYKAELVSTTTAETAKNHSSTPILKNGFFAKKQSLPVEKASKESDELISKGNEFIISKL
jgi:histidine decarboxylase